MLFPDSPVPDERVGWTMGGWEWVEGDRDGWVGVGAEGWTVGWQWVKGVEMMRLDRWRRI